MFYITCACVCVYAYVRKTMLALSMLCLILHYKNVSLKADHYSFVKKRQLYNFNFHSHPFGSFPPSETGFQPVLSFFLHFLKHLLLPLSSKIQLKFKGFIKITRTPAQGIQQGSLWLISTNQSMCSTYRTGCSSC